MDIWERIEQIQDVQRPLSDIEAGHAAKLEPSFRHDGDDYSCGLT